MPSAPISDPIPTPVTPRYLRRVDASTYLRERWGLSYAKDAARQVRIDRRRPEFLHDNGRTPLYPESELDESARSRLSPLKASTSDSGTVLEPGGNAMRASSGGDPAHPTTTAQPHSIATAGNELGSRPRPLPPAAVRSATYPSAFRPEIARAFVANCVAARIADLSAPPANRATRVGCGRPTSWLGGRGVNRGDRLWPIPRKGWVIWQTGRSCDVVI